MKREWKKGKEGEQTKKIQKKNTKKKKRNEGKREGKSTAHSCKRLQPETKKPEDGKILLSSTRHFSLKQRYFSRPYILLAVKCCNNYFFFFDLNVHFLEIASTSKRPFFNYSRVNFPICRLSTCSLLARLLLRNLLLPNWLVVAKV